MSNKVTEGEQINIFAIGRSCFGCFVCNKILGSLAVTYELEWAKTE